MIRSCIIMLLCILMTVSSSVFAQGKGKPTTGREAFNLSVDEKQTMLRKAAGGDGEAAFKLSLYYRFIRSDQAEVNKWQKIAAELGHPAAQYNMGVGFSEYKDADSQRMALYWYKRAAESGDISALLSLAEAYADGKGVEKSYNRAREWCEKAALKGNVYAMVELAGYFNAGKGGAKDNVKAVAWLELALAANRSHSGSIFGFAASVSDKQRTIFARRMTDRRKAIESWMSRIEIKRAKELYEKLCNEVPMSSSQ